MKILKISEQTDNCEGCEHYASQVSSGQHEDAGDRETLGKLNSQGRKPKLDDETHARGDVDELVVERQKDVHCIDDILLTRWTVVEEYLKECVDAVTYEEAKNNTNNQNALCEEVLRAIG